MSNQPINDILANRAEAESAEHIVCDDCIERVVFLLRDKDHDFSVGLTTLLECLVFAIRNGDLPKLPSSWCSDVSSAFLVDFTGEVSYNDSSYRMERSRNSETLQDGSKPDS